MSPLEQNYAEQMLLALAVLERIATALENIEANQRRQQQ